MPSTASKVRELRKQLCAIELSRFEKHVPTAKRSLVLETTVIHAEAERVANALKFRTSVDDAREFLGKFDTLKKLARIVDDDIENCLESERPGRPLDGYEGALSGSGERPSNFRELALLDFQCQRQQVLLDLDDLASLLDREHSEREVSPILMVTAINLGGQERSKSGDGLASVGHKDGEHSEAPSEAIGGEAGDGDSAYSRRTFQQHKAEQAKTAAAPPGPTVNEDSHLSPAKLAELFKVAPDPLRKRLDRWRQKCHVGWIENPDRAPREPKYVYKVGAVRPIIEALRATSETTSERPARKN